MSENGQTPGERLGRAVLVRVQLLGLLSLVAGAIPGWIGGLVLRDEQATASLASRFHWALFVLLPAALIAAERFWGQTEVGGVERAEGMVGLLLAGLLGSTAGDLLFFLASTYIPVVFGGLDWATLQHGFFSAVGWTAIAALVAVTTLTAIPVAIWGRRSVHR